MTTTDTCQIDEIIASIFSTMLDMETCRIDRPVPETHDGLIASIQITGEWEGSMVLVLPLDAVQIVTEAMLGIPIEEQTGTDQEDVAAELVNVVGGNLKGVLPGPSALSLPTVISGKDFTLRVPGAKCIDNATMSCGDGLVHSSVYQKAT